MKDDYQQSQIIVALIQDESESEAFSRATLAFDRLIGPSSFEKVFNDYNTFDPDRRQNHMSNAPDLPRIASLASVPGQAMLKRAREQQREAFKDNLKEVQDKTDGKTIDEIYDIETAFPYFERLGESRGNSVYIYDQDSFGLQTDKAIDRKIADVPPEEMWVIPAKVIR